LGGGTLRATVMGGRAACHANTRARPRTVAHAHSSTRTRAAAQQQSSLPQLKSAQVEIAAVKSMRGKVPSAASDAALRVRGTCRVRGGPEPGAGAHAAAVHRLP
jgi:hypothetical protein